MSAAVSAENAAPRRRRLRPFVGLAIAAALLVTFHAPLLRGVLNFLVVDASLPDKCDVLLVRADVESIRAVAELHRQGRVERVLIPPEEPRTTDRLGLTDSLEVETRRELAARGVPEAIIETIPVVGFEPRDRVVAGGEYLRAHPERRLNIAAPRLLGRYMRRLVHESVAVELLPRIGYASVAPQQFDEQQWWRSRIAVQRVFQSYAQLTTETTTDLPRDLHEPIDWQAWEATVAKGEKP